MLTAPVWTQTFEGIDTCGARVAEEVEGYIKEHPSLARISVIGHSMGGLVARYLIGAPLQINVSP